MARLEKINIQKAVLIYAHVIVTTQALNAERKYCLKTITSNSDTKRLWDHLERRDLFGNNPFIPSATASRGTAATRSPKEYRFVPG